jgi:hypothetical protein
MLGLSATAPIVAYEIDQATGRRIPKLEGSGAMPYQALLKRMGDARLLQRADLMAGRIPSNLTRYMKSAAAQELDIAEADLAIGAAIGQPNETQRKIATGLGQLLNLAKEHASRRKSVKKLNLDEQTSSGKGVRGRTARTSAGDGAGDGGGHGSGGEVG